MKKKTYPCPILFGVNLVFIQFIMNIKCADLFILTKDGN